MQMIAIIKSIAANRASIDSIQLFEIAMYSTVFIAVIGSIFANIKFLILSLTKLIKDDGSLCNATTAQTSQISNIILVIIVCGGSNFLFVYGGSDFVWETAILVGVLDILGIIVSFVAKMIKY